MVYYTDRSKAVVPVLVLLFVALWFILRGGLFYVLPCVILFLCFSVLFALRLPRLGKRELILVLSYVCSICACLDLSISSSSWCQRRAAVCDCGTPWTFLLPFFCFFDAVCSKSCLVLVCPCVFSVLWALQLPRLEKRELILVLLVRFYSIAIVLFYLFPPPVGVWEGLRFLIVALAGFLCFSVLWALRLPHLGKRELILVLLVRFFSIAIVWFYLFPFPLGVWEGLWFLIVALAGLFSYPF